MEAGVWLLALAFRKRDEVLEKLSLEEMRQIELDIARDIDRVCRENDIEYVLGYGSCLGAIRHGGFIPWDDDMDIVMLRPDYERFLTVFNECRSDDRFRLVSYRDKSAPCAFAKVVDQTTWVEERYSEACYGSGVWVDIFPLDEVPGDRADRLFLKCSIYSALRYLAVTDTSTGASSAVKLAKKIVCPIVKKFGPYRFAKKLDECAMSCAGSRAAQVADLVSEASSRCLFDRAMFEPAECSFSGNTLFVPRSYETVLEKWYGDWRTLPPESEREPHTANAYRL